MLFRSWQWAPLALFIGSLALVAEFFVADSWSRFLIYAGCAGLPFGLLLLFFISGLKERIIKDKWPVSLLPRFVEVEGDN